ncbi:tetratricopeptide repeat protein, partial [bacterium]|nr:tetratricopeptide repeat protein [bacterium]
MALEVEQARADPARAFGPFLLLSELGKGGMGVVYRAWNDRLRRVVALKTVIKEDADEESALRFQREAEAVARLRHPAIVSVYEAGEISGKQYLAMELVPGASLAARLRGDAKLALTKALEALRDVARAIHYAHEQGVIHRDLKPQNIMIDKEDRPHVLDFGLARLSDRSKLTKTGATMGTPAYMPPEQAGATEAEIDERSDVYSLGATLYHVLTGRPPFEGQSEVAVIAALLTKDPVPPGTLNPRAKGDLETIALKCLEKEREKRYASAEALARDLEAYLGGDPIAARPIGSLERLVRRVRRNKLATALGALAVLGSLSGLAFGARALEASRQQEAEATKEREQKEEHRKTVVETIARTRKEGSRYHETAVETLVRLGEPQTVSLLSKELDRIASELGKTKGPLPALEAAGDLELAGVACEALGMIALSEDAVPALGRYLASEQDEGRAAFAAEALLKIARERKDARATALVEAARDGRFGWNTLFWKRARHLYPEAPSAPSRDPRTPAEWHDRGLLRREKGDLEGAISDFTRALELDPRSASVWSNRANTRAAKRDLEGAIADYGKAIEIDPSFATAWNNRGGARQKKRDLEGAISDYGKALELDPRDPSAWSNRGGARQVAGDLEGAISDLTRAIEIDPRRAVAWSNRGATKQKKGDFQGAFSDYEKALELDPHLAMAWRNRGSARHGKGDLEGAISDYTRALDVDPGDAEAWTARGNARKAKGDLEGAISDFGKALELDPRLAAAWYNRGNARWAKGD